MYIYIVCVDGKMNTTTYRKMNAFTQPPVMHYVRAYGYA